MASKATRALNWGSCLFRLAFTLVLGVGFIAHDRSNHNFFPAAFWPNFRGPPHWVVIEDEQQYIVKLLT